MLASVAAMQTITFVIYDYCQICFDWLQTCLHDQDSQIDCAWLFQYPVIISIIIISIIRIITIIITIATIALIQCPLLWLTAESRPGAHRDTGKCCKDTGLCICGCFASGEP